MASWCNRQRDARRSELTWAETGGPALTLFLQPRRLRNVLHQRLPRLIF